MDADRLKLCRHNFWCVRELVRTCARYDIGVLLGWADTELNYSTLDEKELKPGFEYVHIFSFKYTDQDGQGWEGEYTLEDFEKTRFENHTEPKNTRTIIYMPPVDGPFGSFGEVEFTFWMR